ncbi:MAG: hypothetical protein EBW44_12285 [Rhodobacteraceae bacterium]|nr:hypothetical protein [Paracoccaceae bacterium]
MRKFMVVLDDSKECLNAMRFAAMRAANSGGGVTILSVISPDEFNHWIGVSDIMREEARERIEVHFEVFAKWMRDRKNIEPELVIREGEVVSEILAQIQSDPEIGVLVLGAGLDKKGPGPLVTQMSKNAGTAGNSPLAQRLFAVAGVRGVFLGRDFVTITKDEATDWDHAKPALLGAIMEHFQSGQPVIQGDQAADHGTQHSEEDAGIVSQIKELLDSRVRPAVAQDGGDITFHGFERGVVYLQMKGACAGCPSSTMTLKMGIENLLRHYIPEVTEVRPVGL